MKFVLSYFCFFNRMNFEELVSSHYVSCGIVYLLLYFLYLPCYIIVTGFYSASPFFFPEHVYKRCNMNLRLSVYAQCPYFKSAFHLVNACDNYSSYRHNGQFRYAEIHIISTCAKCYRTIFYDSCTQYSHADYRSFRTFTELCAYLEEISQNVVKSATRLRGC